jgi:hypothetical protein
MIRRTPREGFAPCIGKSGVGAKRFFFKHDPSEVRSI